VAVTPPSPLVLHTQGGSQLSVFVAALRMKRQSVAVGPAPPLTGWAQSPSAAEAGRSGARSRAAATDSDATTTRLRTIGAFDTFRLAPAAALRSDGALMIYKRTAVAVSKVTMPRPAPDR
jgi:hypothetical protein